MPSDADTMLFYRRAMLFTASLFSISLLLPAIAICTGDTPGGAQWNGGLYLLLTGWLGITMAHMSPSLAIFAWFANIPLLLNWLKLRKGIAPSLPLAAIGFALAAAVLLPFDFPRQESRLPYPVCGRGLGYWLWLGACGVLLHAAWKLRRKSSEPAQ